MNNKIKKILKYLKQELTKTYDKDLSSVILYGSQSREDFVEGSDIDILIVLNNETKPVQEVRKLSSLLSGISLKFNYIVSCVFISKNRYEKEESPLILNIKKEGIVL